MNTKKIPFNENCKKTTIYIALCAVIALISCFAAEHSNAVVFAITTFIGDVTVLAMFTLYFAMTANTVAEAYPDSRSKIFCTADCTALVLKISFTALCSLSGSITIHGAALIADAVFSRAYTLKLIKSKTDPAKTRSV